MLERNINLFIELLSVLVLEKEAEADYSQLLIKITRWVRESFNKEDVLKTTSEEIRKALSIDRVTIFCFNSNSNGTFIAESVAPGLPKILGVTVSDPGFEQGLESFAVKANLVAPIIKDEQLFGLLIAHQCSEPRDWQQPEIDLFTQIAMQVGFTLDHARLLQAYQVAEANSGE
ncbi:GAF domain-containing protein [Nostoc sp.]|uniref:GAF domain-containing protein n=1 Tax=Nostoc sp. TaxID=1180 RepID=UPI002FF96727